MLSGDEVFQVGLSSGKDSTAALLFLIFESGIPRERIIATFCDTQNEAPESYAHIQMLAEKVHPIITIPTEGFFNLVKRKKTFPTRRKRFCTEELKLLPTRQFLDELSDWDYNEESETAAARRKVVTVSGVRKDESEKRAKLKDWGTPEESFFNLPEWRPILEWSIDDVWAIHAKYNISPNPLYSYGASRVGCWPCFQCSKDELKAIALHRPEKFEQIAEWERLVQIDNPRATFFHRKTVPERFRTKSITTDAGNQMKVCTIEDVLAWAKTGWRAQGLSPEFGGLFQFNELRAIDNLCVGRSMACE